MDRNTFFSANIYYQEIELIKDKKSKLMNVPDQIIEILIGHIEIPDAEVRDVIKRIKNLGIYLDKEIEGKYKKIDEL
jgi:hypothetical protein